METPFYYQVRVWLPDRPGALGQVASRIGAVGGDVIGIEIMERGTGIAVDDLVVCLPHADLVHQLRKEIGEVDDVRVEGIRQIESARTARELVSLDIAASLAARGANVLEVLTDRLMGELAADWAAIVQLDPAEISLKRGEPPSALWLAGFLEGARHLGDGHATPTGIVWAYLPENDAAIVIGRADYPFRWRERGEVSGLAAVADALTRPSVGPGPAS